MGETREVSRMLTRSVALFSVFIAVVDAVWKPKGNMHAHESPEFLFRQGDKNRDDYLDAAELADFYTHNEEQYHGHEIQLHFGGQDKATAALDLDKDGKVSASEFLDYASPAHARAVAWDDWDLANKNKDDGLDLQEYKKTHYGKERVIDANHDGFDQHFKELDVNNDGKLEKEEWLASPAAMDPFSHMDYNGDKLVEFEEFARNEKEHYHGLDHDSEEARAHTREAFDILDKDKDGKLTRAEDRGQQPDEHEYEKVDFEEEEEDEDEDEEEEEEDNEREL